MPHDVANTTLQADEEAQDPQVESQRAPRLGSLACWFGYTCRAGVGGLGFTFGLWAGAASCGLEALVLILRSLVMEAVGRRVSMRRRASWAFVLARFGWRRGSSVSHCISFSCASMAGSWRRFVLRCSSCSFAMASLAPKNFAADWRRCGRRT